MLFVLLRGQSFQKLDRIYSPRHTNPTRRGGKKLNPKSDPSKAALAQTTLRVWDIGITLLLGGLFLVTIATDDNEIAPMSTLSDEKMLYWIL
jgi:hypothetical protein